MGAHMKMDSKMYVGQSVCTFLLLGGVLFIGWAPPPPSLGLEFTGAYY